ncbi:nucleoid-associated protein [Iodidimonas muriae]|uniref:Nucleoid-associated protein GCM10007972_05730 n=1 Tax=Iodidimonas muriae TaxID=261467 RepID=A0ABQ2L8J1_9PROT|nr:YbaB/EbfC family nucleoid-associated protein [Iodidimonas muriae]GER05801.1 nucleoid-associated protein [Kordiimonadales bacterium JCM 17843]GGO06940.1 nucleoid-associated protein [Iodidimonas muriae]
MKNLGQMLKQAQQMQQKMADMQQALDAIEVEGHSGGGLVVVRLSAKGDLRNVKIDPSLLKADEGEILEDLIKAAHADAREKAQERSQEEMKKVTGGLNLPEGMQLPF